MNARLHIPFPKGAASLQLLCGTDHAISRSFCALDFRYDKVNGYSHCRPARVPSLGLRAQLDGDNLVLCHGLNV